VCAPLPFDIASLSRAVAAREAFAEAEFLQSLGQLFIVRRLAMPSCLILHEADALTLDGIGENDNRPSLRRLRLLKRVHYLTHVVSVYPHHVPAETGVLGTKGLNVHHIFHPAINLQTVAVDDAD